jgi:hypothetical protein
MYSSQENKLIVASTAGDGFVVPMDEVLAQTRNGKQVLNVKGSCKSRGQQNSYRKLCGNRR